MTNFAPFHSQLAIVLGCGDVGSAVAWTLHRAGFAVALVDEADPAWHRRGMAFTDAWYVGTAELHGEGACFCASLKSMPSILRRRMIAATTWSWRGIVAAFETSVLVDARGRKRRTQGSMRGRVPVTIGIGAELEGLDFVDVAVPGPAASSPSIESGRHGRFATERRIGDSVTAGQIVGAIGNEVVEAPACGVLVGLAARGARIEPGDALVDVDSERAQHACYGIADGPRKTALRVLAECKVRLGSSSCCNTPPSKFESHIMDEEYTQ